MTSTGRARGAQAAGFTVRGRPAPNRVLAVASFGALLAFLDATIVNIAIPNIQASFAGSSLSALSWVLNAYNIVFAAFLVVFGRIADLVGRRRLLSAGTILFTLASLWCAVAPSLTLLVVARVVQGLGAAMLVPASLAVVVAAFPAERRSHAVGLWGAAAAFAAGLGPPLGGVLIDLGDAVSGGGGWRWAFLVNLPFGILAVLLNRRVLVESRSPELRRIPDIRGAVLLAAALGLLTLGIVQGNEWGWGSARVLAALGGAAVLGAGFVLSSRRHPRPLLDPALLRIPSFTLGNLGTFLAGMGFFAYMLTNILWLQYVWHYSVAVAGLALVPSAVVAVIVAAALGDVAHRHGYRVIVAVAALVWAGAYLWYARVPQTEPNFLLHWLPGQLLSGIGSGAVLPLLGSATLEATPRGRFATSSAIASASRQVGGVLGIAILVIIIGTPSLDTPVTALRRGWLFSALCFAVVAVVALLVRRPTETLPETDESTDLRAARVVLPEPEDDDGQIEAALRPYPRGSYLDDLPESLRRRLDLAGRDVPLRAGTWLFKEGDRASSLYLVRAGRIEIVQDGTVIRELGPGSVLGELALLSGGDIRSASARARRDSVLSEVSPAAFALAMEQETGAAMALAGALARALQSRGLRHQEASSAARLVAVVGLSAGSPATEVAATLAELLRALPTAPRVHLTGEVGADGLARAEREHDRVIAVAPWPGPGESTAWWDACRRQADRVVLVADPLVDPPSDWVPAGAVRDLVVVGPPGSPSMSGQVVRRWAAAVHPDRIIECSSVDLAGGLRSLAAAIGSCAVGLVLAGGGARALSHLGVLHELEDAGIVVDRVAGSSFGAIIAAAYATGRNARQVEDAVYHEFVRQNPFGDYTVPARSLMKGHRAEVGLRRSLGPTTRIDTLPRRFRCLSTDLLGRRPYVHETGLLWEAVAASARLPVIFPPLRQDGRLLIDGSVLDNLPVELLTERDEGPVIAVNIGGSGAARPVGSNQPVRIPGIGETLFRTMTISSAGAVERARAAGAFVVSPPTLGVGLMEYHQIDRLLEAGRIAARALLEATGGDFTRRD